MVFNENLNKMEKEIKKKKKSNMMVKKDDNV